MRLVVADTSPFFYLLSIGLVEILPKLFGRVFMPDAVFNELAHPAASTVVHEWVAKLPAWVEVTTVAHVADPSLDPLGLGERAAITLALALRADSF